MSVDANSFCSLLISKNFDLFAGVPDSLLKDLCAHLQATMQKSKYLITANEGSAVGVACGYHIGTQKYGVVFMQNSGIGNAVNPLLSIADRAVYSIPLLMIIGWRGRPGEPDEPQHVAQGLQTIPLLEVLDIPYVVLDETNWSEQVTQMLATAIQFSRPCAVVIKRGFFTPVEISSQAPLFQMNREQALEVLVNEINEADYIVCTTGKASRELFEIRERLSQAHSNDLLVVGGMGHASSIAVGIAMSCQNDVWCFDGDGSFIMHMGALPALVHALPNNFRYIINANGVHESVGGQPTVSLDIDLTAILKAIGFHTVVCAKTEAQLTDEIHKARLSNCPSAIVVYTSPGSRTDLGRPTQRPVECKEALMKSIVKAKAIIRN